uniref:Chitin-binding type-2 domain-containing protein n=1 Tax=Anopheles funestus TaxID=62324 RepID=A0A182R1Y4_ANOFN
MLSNVLFLFSVSTLVVSAVNIDPRCTRYSLGMQAQVLSYEQDCRKFIICDMRGNGQMLSCPTGLYFSDISHTCSFETTSCTHGELNGAINTLPSVPSRPVQPSLPVQPLPVPIPIPHLPLQPQPIPLPEPPKIPHIPHVPPVVVVPDVTDAKPPISNWLPIVTAPPTVVGPVQEQSEVGQLPAESVCWDKPAGKIYPVVHDCGLYVVCMGDRNAIVQRCPKGLLYDHKQERCEFADASRCSIPRDAGQLVLDINGVDMSLLEEERLNSQLEESYAIPMVPVKQSVSALASDKVQRENQPIRTVSELEKQPELVVEQNFLMINDHPRCLARNNFHLTVELPHDTDCTKYLVCIGRVAIEKKCPNGQHWNARNNWCDYASAAGCTL